MAILNIHRVPFNAVAGLTINQRAAGSGIEAVYSTSLTGAFGNLVTNLFTQNAAAYPHVLDQLAGAEYADYLQSLQWSGSDFDRIISGRIDCSDDYHYSSGGSPASCRTPGQASVWGRVTGEWGDHTGDIEAPKYKTTQDSIYFGGDYSVTGPWIIGAAGGWVENNLSFPTTHASIKTSGWQAGVYSSYEPGDWYVRGIVGYGQYNGDGHRLIDIVPNLSGFVMGSGTVSYTHLTL